MRSVVKAVLLVGAMLAMPGSLYAQAPNWPVERPPQPLPARDVKFPPYEIRTLQNGLQVVVVQHHEQPILTLRMLIRSGAASDPSQKQGVAVLTAALLDQGTATRSAEQIADTIDSIGGGLGTGAGTDLSYANILVMKDSLSLGFELLNDVVRNPAFKGDELERQRQQAISGLRVSYEDPDYVAGLVFDRLVYGFHPYGLPNNGTPESLQSITVDDLRAFHKAHYAPNNAILTIVGDVDTKKTMALVDKYFGSIPKQPAPTRPDLKEPAHTAERRSTIDVLAREITPSLRSRTVPRLTSPYRLITIPATSKRVYVQWQGRP